MCTNQHCCGSKPLTNLRYYKNKHVFLAAYLAVAVGLLFTCIFPLTHSFSCLQVSVVLKTTSHSMGRFQSDPTCCLFTCAQTWKIFFQGPLPTHRTGGRPRADLPLHNNSRQEYWSGVPLPSPYARLREGILRQCIKILQLFGNCAKSIFNKAVSYQMDISLILPGNSAAFNNQASISFLKIFIYDIIFYDITLQISSSFLVSTFQEPYSLLCPLFSIFSLHRYSESPDLQLNFQLPFLC